MSSSEPIQFGGIRISSDALAELDEDRAVVRVQRTDVVRIALQKGWHSNHPIIQIAFGGILVAIGLIPIPVIANWLLFGGILSAKWFWLLTTLVFGAWVVYDGTKRGYFLAVEGNSFRKKLCFHRRRRPDEIEVFLQQAEKLFGYSFER